MVEIQSTDEFSKWLRKLNDNNARLRIAKRLQDIAFSGHFGDARPVGDGISELRFHFGPGYRVYFTMRGDTLVIVLAGGSKASQSRDIEKAKTIAKRL